PRKAPRHRALQSPSVTDADILSPAYFATSADNDGFDIGTTAAAESKSGGTPFEPGDAPFDPLNDAARLLTEYVGHVSDDPASFQAHSNLWSTQHSTSISGFPLDEEDSVGKTSLACSSWAPRHHTIASP